jgi:dipeptidyl-peptidase 4
MTRDSIVHRYEAAEALLPHRWPSLVYPGSVKPHWINGRDAFWFKNRTRDGTTYLAVEPAERTCRPLFDHAALKAALQRVLRHEVEEPDLPIDALDVFSEDEIGLHVRGRTFTWHCAAASLTETPETPPDRFLEQVSPDGRWSIVVREHNLFARSRADGDETQLTFDGTEAYSYGTPIDICTDRFTLARHGLQIPPAIAWSPDSRRFVSHRVDQRELPFMHYIESAPDDGGRPRLFAQRYAMTGEPSVPVGELCIFDVNDWTMRWADCGPLLFTYVSPIRSRQLWWSSDSKCVFFLDADRGDRKLRLRALNSATGETEILIEEQSETQVQIHPLWLSGVNVRVLSSGEIIWWSERSGYGHLYVYEPGRDPRSLTAGEWLVRDLVSVDEDERVALFTASGRESELDPYIRQVYRVPIDGGPIERLTDDTLDHSVIGSPSGKWMIDTTSWIDTPDKSVLRHSSGAPEIALAQANAELLYAAGWRPPERISVKAADGVTDLYGLLYRPGNFDPDSKYAVLEDIYPGPQRCAASVRFCDPRLSPHAAAMAALGFAVVVLDARGTPMRSKAFHEHCRAERHTDYLDDHVSGLRQLAAVYSWIDLERLGIYGHSGGGRSAVRAMLRYPEAYKVAVALAGNHDDLLNHPVWSEKYIGFPDEVDYAEHSNPPHVDRLRGKLLLIHGELDDNVHPPMTLRLVKALVEADKNFDLLIVPDADHAMLVHQPYWIRRRWDYFVEHLLKEKPPAYRIAAFPVTREMVGETLESDG